MKTKIIVAIAACLACFTSLRSQTTSASPTPSAVLQDNRFIAVDLSTTDPDYTNRGFGSKDSKINTLIHYNARVANYGGFSTGSTSGTTSPTIQAPTPFPPDPTPGPSATPASTPTSTPTPTPTSTPVSTPAAATPTPTPTTTKAKKPKKPKTARGQAQGGNGNW